MNKTLHKQARALPTAGLIISLLGLTVASGATGCADTQAARSGERNADVAMATQVSTALGHDDRHRYFSGVYIQADDGVVKLSGYVTTIDLKRAAGEIAKNVAGVKDVRNAITVKSYESARK